MIFFFHPLHVDVRRNPSGFGHQGPVYVFRSRLNGNVIVVSDELFRPEAICLRVEIVEYFGFRSRNALAGVIMEETVMPEPEVVEGFQTRRSVARLFLQEVPDQIFCLVADLVG